MGSNGLPVGSAEDQGIVLAAFAAGLGQQRFIKCCAALQDLMTAIIKFPQRLGDGLALSLIIGRENAAEIVDGGNIIIAHQQQRVNFTNRVLSVAQH